MATTNDVPDELATALEGSPYAKTAFEAMAPSHRREYTQWISEAKKPETRERRAAQAIERLLGPTSPA